MKWIALPLWILGWIVVYFGCIRVYGVWAGAAAVILVATFSFFVWNYRDPAKDTPTPDTQTELPKPRG